MEAPLKSLCLACAKYTAGDHAAKALAAVCLAPYFVIYHAFVLLHARREVHMMFVLLGLLLNAGLGFAIKRALRHPRPPATCAALGICHKWGMPSSHMQVMSFAVATALLLYWHRQSAPQRAAPFHPASRALRQLQLLLFGGLAIAVGYARVRLGYHTPAQVVAGAAVGAAFAAAWHCATMALARPYFGAIERLSARLGLYLRDTLDWEDVHRAEYEAFGASAQHSKGKRE